MHRPQTSTSAQTDLSLVSQSRCFGIQTSAAPDQQIIALGSPLTAFVAARDFQQRATLRSTWDEIYHVSEEALSQGEASVSKGGWGPAIHSACLHRFLTRYPTDPDLAAAHIYAYLNVR